MAIYHLNAKIISRSAGRCATAAAAYRAAVKLKDERTNIIFDYTRKKFVAYRRVFPTKHSPEWVADRERLWNEAEKAEKRKDAQVAREIEVALPIELTEREQVALLERYIHTQFTRHGIVADAVIHQKIGNPHAHILLTTREITADGFGKKNRAWNSKEQLLQWREQWAVHCNRRLLIAGRRSRVDHRTLKDQGLTRLATVHIGPTSTAMNNRGIPAERCKINSIIKEKNMSDNKAHADAILLHEDIGGHKKKQKSSFRYLYPSDDEDLRQYREAAWSKKYLPILKQVLVGRYSSIETLQTEVGFCYRVNIPEGAIYDYGAQIKCESGSQKEIELVVLLAKEKGWKGLKITGDRDFKEAVFLEAIISGAFTLEQVSGYEPTPENLCHIRECMQIIKSSKETILSRVVPDEEDAGTGGAESQINRPKLKF